MHRLGTWHDVRGAGKETRLETHAAEELFILQVIGDATRALLRLPTPGHATEILTDVVERFGGRVVPAVGAGSDAVPIDLSFGEREPVLPAAPVDSLARRRIEVHLPGLVEDARHMVVLARRLFLGDPRFDVGTGLLTAATVADIIPRLGETDTVVRIDLDAAERDGALVDLARVILSTVHAADRAGRWRDGAILLLHHTDPGGAAALVERLRTAWRREWDGMTFSAGIAAVGSDGGAGAVDAAEDALEIARDEGDRTELAAIPDVGV